MVKKASKIAWIRIRIPISVGLQMKRRKKEQMSDRLLVYVLTLLHLTLGLADPFLVTVGRPSSFSLTPCKTRSTGTDLDLSWCSGVSNNPADLHHKI